MQTYEKFAHPEEAVGFSGFRGNYLTSGGAFRGVETPVGAMLWDI